MEHKKDSFYRTSKAFNKGQELSSTTIKGSVQKSDNVESSFPTNVPEYSFDIFLNKKTEKLTTALYMVTSFLSDSEPLKWKLRERSIDLLSDISTVRNGSVSEVENIFADYSPCIEEIISLLEVAVASKLISEMNFSILKKEYVSLNLFITSDKYANKRTGRFIFPQSFFLKDDTLNANSQSSELPTSNNNTDTEHSKGHNEGQREYIGQQKIPDSASVSVSVSKRQKNNYPVERPIKDKLKVNQNTKESKAGRRVIILKLFKKNKELTIKDISCEVSGCSEKTIQRELSALVSTGVLNKKGERRWSKYSLK